MRPELRRSDLDQRHMNHTQLKSQQVIQSIKDVKIVKEPPKRQTSHAASASSIEHSNKQSRTSPGLFPNPYTSKNAKNDADPNRANQFNRAPSSSKVSSRQSSLQKSNQGSVNSQQTGNFGTLKTQKSSKVFNYPRGQTTQSATTQAKSVMEY